MTPFIATLSELAEELTNEIRYLGALETRITMGNGDAIALAIVQNSRDRLRNLNERIRARLNRG